MNVDSPRERWSAAPTRVKIRSKIDSSAFDAGTNEPACARSTAVATWRRYVDLPPMFGPVTTRIRFSGREVAVVRDERLLAAHGLDDRMACVGQAEPRARGEFRAHPPPGSGGFREARGDVDRRDARGDGRDAWPARREIAQQLAVDPALDLADPLFRSEDLLFELLQGRA